MTIAGAILIGSILLAGILLTTVGISDVWPRLSFPAILFGGTLILFGIAVL